MRASQYAPVEQRLTCLITLPGLDTLLLSGDSAVVEAAHEVEGAVDAAALVAYCAGAACALPVNNATFVSTANTSFSTHP